ncbi:MAG: hypothetical protein AAF614_36420 [Chloroflexota bacterium]
MEIAIFVIQLILQIILAQLLGFGGATALGVGNGWELLVIPLGNVVGVWGIGAVIAKLRGNYAEMKPMLRLAGTAVFAFLGVLLILITPAFGFAQLLFPLLGAVIGYYVAPLLYK